MFASEALDKKAKGYAQPSPKTGSKLLLWILVFTMSIFLVSVTLIASTIEEANQNMAIELDSINQSLAVTPEPNPTELALSEELLALRAASAEADMQLSQLQSSYINWPSIMTLLSSYDGNQMQLVSLMQENNHLSLTAYAQDENLISNYVDTLRSSSFFASVNIQSISLKTPESDSSDASLAPSYLEFVLSIEIEVD